MYCLNNVISTWGFRNNVVLPENQVLLTSRFYELGAINQAVGDFVSTVTAVKIDDGVT